MGCVKRHNLIGYVLAILMLIGAGLSSAQSYPVQFALSQADVFLPRIRVYSYLADQQGAHIQDVTVSDVALKLDGQDLAVDDVKTFTQTGEGVAYTLLVDVSGTMAGRPFKRASQDTDVLIEKLNPKDRLALITFGDTVEVVSDYSLDREALKSLIKSIKPNHQTTKFYEAVVKALELNKRRDPDLPTRRVIAVITDGKDEGSGLTFDDILRENELAGLPIYTIGYTKINPKHLEELKRLSALNGGLHLRWRRGQDPGRVYEDILNHVRDQFVITARYPAGTADGSVHNIQAIYTKAGQTITADKRVQFLYAEAKEPEAEPILDLKKPRPWWHWAAAGGAAFLVVLLVVVLIVALRKKPEPEQPEEPQPAVAPPPPPPPRPVRAMTEDLDPVAVTPQEDPNWPRIAFFVFRGPDQGRKLEAGVGPTGLTLGGHGARISVDDPDVSGVLATVFFVNGRFVLETTDPAVPIFLNGIPVADRHVLDDDDTVDLGRSTLRVQISGI